MSLLFFAAVALVAVLRLRVSVVSVMVLQLAASVVGMFLLADSGDVSWPVFGGYLLAVGALAGGGLLARLRNRPCVTQDKTVPPPTGRSVAGARTLSAPVMWSMIAVSSGFAFYHLLISGLPIFASNVEIDRFDFTSSGFFGVPGRMFLFGLKIAWVAASANAAAQGIRWTSSPPWIVASTSLLLASLASGFKGQILSLALMFLVVWLLTHREPFRYWDVLRRFWFLGVAAVGYFLVVAGLYSTYQASQSVLQSAFDRWTTGSAETPGLVLSGGVPRLPANALLNDVLYYAWHYAHIRPGAEVSLERVVSASITGVDPVTALWVVPVNVGGYAEMAVSFGVPMAIAGMTVFGWLLGRLAVLPTTGAIGNSIRILAVLVLMSAVVKGGFVYLVVNWGAVVAMIAVTGLLAHVLFDRPDLRRFRPTSTLRSRARLPAASFEQEPAP